MSTARIGLAKRAIADLSFAMSRDAFALGHEVARAIPRKARIDKLSAEIEANKERLRILRAQLAELEEEYQRTQN